MKTWTARSLLLATLTMPVVLPASDAATVDPDTGGALRAIAGQVEAWNRGDLEAFTSLYADRCTFVTPDGVTRGRDEVLERYRSRYPDRAAMGTLTIDVRDVNAVRGSDGAVVAVTMVARWSLHRPDATDGGDTAGWTLLVVERTGDGWSIVQDASM